MGIEKRSSLSTAQAIAIGRWAEQNKDRIGGMAATVVAKLVNKELGMSATGTNIKTVCDAIGVSLLRRERPVGSPTGLARRVAALEALCLGLIAYIDDTGGTDVTEVSLSKLAAAVRAARGDV